MPTRKTNSPGINETLPSELLRESLSFLTEVELRMASLSVCKDWTMIGTELVHATPFNTMDYRALCWTRYKIDVQRVELALQPSIITLPKFDRLRKDNWRLFYNTSIFMEDVTKRTQWMKKKAPIKPLQQYRLELLRLAYRYICYQFDSVPQPLRFCFRGYRYHRERWYSKVKMDCDTVNRRWEIIDLDNWLAGMQAIDSV